MTDSGQERTEEATPRRKQEARKKGTIARSADLTHALVVFALVFTLPIAISNLGKGMTDSIRAGMGTLPMDVTRGSLQRFGWAMLEPGLKALIPIVLTALIVGVIANVAQVGFVLSGESLMPQWAKINPLQGLKRLFSLRASMEGIKAVVKSAVFFGLAYSAVADQWNTVVGLSWLTPVAAASKVGELVLAILWRVVIAWLILAVLDYWFQRKQTDKSLRMTKDELKREFKEQEQSPELKSEIASRRRKMAKGRMMDRVKSADVVVTNPTHYAIALQYDRSKMHAPIVVGKGQDYLALKIREVAKAHKVPIVRNPPLARALYRQCEIGDFVPRDLFQAVAEVLAFVYRTVRGLRPD